MYKSEALRQGFARKRYNCSSAYIYYLR